jgi:hypothetical protein
MIVIKYRPFYALAAVCGLASAILIGTPALGKQPIKPTPKPASTCCDYDASESPGQAFQAECIEAVELQANSVIQLKAVEENTFISGYWSADWGTINQSGQYTAPSFMPPAGFDTVTFTYETGGEYRTSFQIIQQPGVPLTQGPDGNTYPEIEQIIQQQRTHSAVPIDADGDVIESKHFQTDQPYTLSNFESDGTSSPIILNGVSLVPLGTRGLMPNVEVMVVSANSATKKRKCGVLPPPSDVLGLAAWTVLMASPCQPGTSMELVGPVKYSRKSPIVSITLPYSGFSVTVTITFFQQPAVAYKYVDVNECVDGVWKYKKSKKCTMDGIYAWGFTPSYISGGLTAGIALGFQPDGYKFDFLNPSKWHCNDY